MVNLLPSINSTSKLSSPILMTFPVIALIGPAPPHPPLKFPSLLATAFPSTFERKLKG